MEWKRFENCVLAGEWQCSSLWREGAGLTGGPQEQLGHRWPGGHGKRGDCVGRWGPAFLGPYAFCSLSGVPGKKPLKNFKQGCDMVRFVFCKEHTGFWVKSGFSLTSES